MNRGESAGLCVHRRAFRVRFSCSSQYSPTRLLQPRGSKERVSQLKEIDQSASDVLEVEVVSLDWKWLESCRLRQHPMMFVLLELRSR